MDGGVNTYGYANLNPVGFTDAVGLRTTDKAPDIFDLKPPSIPEMVGKLVCPLINSYCSFRDERIKQENAIYKDKLKAIDKSHDISYQNCVHAPDLQDCIAKDNAARRAKKAKENKRHDRALEDINERYPDRAQGAKEFCDELGE